MHELDDHELLADFARAHSDAAFATLVARYVNLIYSAALRFTTNRHQAEEITQAVFIILSRKAGSLGRNVVLSGWLYQTARLTAFNFVKYEIRRQRREEAAYMESTLVEHNEPAWDEVAPLLEEAMGELGETDRNAVVLRFFWNKTTAQVAAAMNLSEAAAAKRISRAVEKLRNYFGRRGITLSAVILTSLLAANSVQAAPAALTRTVVGIAAKGAAVSGTTLTVVNTTLKIMAWLKIKTVVFTAAAIAVAADSACANYPGRNPVPLLGTRAFSTPAGDDARLCADG